jgi:hypothetical protein
VQVAISILDNEETRDKDKIKEQNDQQRKQWEKQPALRDAFPVERGFRKVSHDSLPAIA